MKHDVPPAALARGAVAAVRESGADVLLSSFESGAARAGRRGRAPRCPARCSRTRGGALARGALQELDAAAVVHAIHLERTQAEHAGRRATGAAGCASASGR